MFNMRQIATLYATETYNYDHDPRRSRGTLVCSGTGLMLSIMDLTPIRHCVDFDTAKQVKNNRIESYMRLVARYAPPLIVAGWFTSTRPEPLQRGIVQVQNDGFQKDIVCYSGGGCEPLHPTQSTELSVFFARVHAALAAP